MDSASHYIRKALQVGTEELAALRRGDVDEATQLSAQRGYLTSLAWTARMDVPKNAFKQDVLQLYSLQETLIQEAQRLKESIRDSLNDTHREQRRMSAYKRAVGYAV